MRKVSQLIVFILFKNWILIRNFIWVLPSIELVDAQFSFIHQKVVCQLRMLPMILQRKSSNLMSTHSPVQKLKTSWKLLTTSVFQNKEVNLSFWWRISMTASWREIVIWLKSILLSPQKRDKLWPLILKLPLMITPNSDNKNSLIQKMSLNKMLENIKLPNSTLTTFILVETSVVWLMVLDLLCQLWISYLFMEDHQLTS